MTGLALGLLVLVAVLLYGARCLDRADEAHGAAEARLNEQILKNGPPVGRQRRGRDGVALPGNPVAPGYSPSPRPWLSGLVDVVGPRVLVSPRGTELHLNDGWAADDVLVTLAEIEALG